MPQGLLAEDPADGKGDETRQCNDKCFGADGSI